MVDNARVPPPPSRSPRTPDGVTGASLSLSQSRPDGDPTADELIRFLTSAGAARRGHGGNRGLLDHLIGTYETVRRWSQPPWLQHAALIHSVYGTEAYHQQLLPLSRRNDVLEIAGEKAERLAYLFGVIPRNLLFAGTHLWARSLPTPLPRRGSEEIEAPSATRPELDSLVLLHMANLAEQARAADGSPGRWLVRLRELADLLIASDVVTLPRFVAVLAAFSETDESLTRRAYTAGIASAGDPEAMASQLALAAAACSAVPEPCIWQAHLSRRRGEVSTAQRWARIGRRRLLDLGTAWDKRLTFDEWLALTELLEQGTDSPPSGAPGEIIDPRTLLEAVARKHVKPVGQPASPMLTEPPIRPPEANAARKRFHRYIETFAQADLSAGRAPYPDLESQPWYEPSDFPLVGYLESNYAAVRDEILTLEPSRFHREGERIERSGDWDVAFLYERGRRNDEVCDACPVTTGGIESYPAMRTAAGLIYASRMRAGTHISAHCGPTNLRVRCHLGIKVPDGDCALRVGDHTRQWQEGRGLVFNDYFEHEAWNHTDDDRIVLIVDLWHPALAATEVRLLEGLHRYAYAYARQLNRYWSSNAQVRAAQAVGEARRSDPG